MITFVAEIGVNHNGKLDEALWLIDQAKAAGADIAKFQLWSNKPELDSLALGRNELMVCNDYCRTKGIEFMCTPFDVQSLWWLVDKLSVRTIKLASSAVFDRELLRQAERTRLPVILSTGMATEKELDAAMRCIRYAPVTLLHCVSSYPTPVDQANLRAITSLATYGVTVGYSDHTGDSLAICAAAALGAKMIEAHLTRDCGQDGPDHACSYEPTDFEYAVEAARTIEAMLGNGKISPQECAMFLRRKFA